MRHITRRWCAIGTCVAIVLIVPASGVQTQQASTSPDDLATLFAPGGMLQDKNGDGVIDFVNARVVMGERPTAADVSAAADLAARFGFETMAMNLPLSSSAQPGATVMVVWGRAARRPPAIDTRSIPSGRPGCWYAT